MPQKPKITVEQVIGAAEGEVVAYYAKGRFSPKEFSKAVAEYTGKKIEGQSIQEFWLNAPAEAGDLDVEFKVCSVFDKGAYPVTVLDVASWDR
jgi:hypothetical protein